MQSIQSRESQSRQAWLWPAIAQPERVDSRPPRPEPIDARPDQVPAPTASEASGAPEREHDANLEIVRLHAEIERLVRNQRENPRQAVDSALESVTRLQIVTANIEACRPPSATFAGAAMVALADAQLRGHADAIERGMTYTADNQLRLLDENESAHQED